MGAREPVSNERILSSYAIHQNVWRVAEEVGLCGQTIHERLTRLGKMNKMNVFTEADKRILMNEYSHFKSVGNLARLARKMGRTKPFICRQARALGLTNAKSRKPYAEKEGTNPYNKNHLRIRLLKGSPHRCEACGEESKLKRYEWANMTGEYENPDDYKRMCVKCHRNYDKNRVMLAHKKTLERP